MKTVTNIKKYPSNLMLSYDSEEGVGVENFNYDGMHHQFTREEVKDMDFLSNYDDESKEKILDALSFCKESTFFLEYYDEDDECPECKKDILIITQCPHTGECTIKCQSCNYDATDLTKNDGNNSK